MRCFFYIAYKGTAYHGWQSQPNAITVQEVVKKALDKILRSNHELVGSGRTDTGVHAFEQVFHTDLTTSLSLEDLQFRLNGFLPIDIAVNSIKQVTDEANARFDATERSYEYHVHFRKTPFQTKESLFIPVRLDFKSMNEAAILLIGSQDFQSFSKVKTEVNNFICQITRAEWVLDGHNAVFYISANRFLRGMVRAIVGTLLDVGQSNLSLANVEEIIKSKDRTKAGKAVSPDGLYLCGIKYPESIFKE